MEVEFEVTISTPNCDDLVLIGPFAPDRIRIHFGSDEQKLQALPTIDDTFGLIKNKFCTFSISMTAEMGDFQSNEYETFLSIADSQIVLITPSKPEYVGTWTAAIHVSLDESNVNVAPLEFKVKIRKPNCQGMILNKPT